MEKAPVEKAPVAQSSSLDLKAASVQQILRANATAQSTNASGASPQAAATRLPPLQFRAPRRVHHHECDAMDCTAYTSDGTALFSFPRDQMLVANEKRNADAWLSCQQNDDMLSTFERYDKCRGVSIGLPPASLGNVEVKLPKARP